METGLQPGELEIVKVKNDGFLAVYRLSCHSYLDEVVNWINENLSSFWNIDSVVDVKIVSIRLQKEIIVMISGFEPIGTDWLIKMQNDLGTDKFSLEPVFNGQFELLE